MSDRSLVANLLRVARLVAVAALLLVPAAWSIGRVASDRTPATQWLLWIPSPAAIVAAALAVALAALRGRRRRRLLLGGALVAMLLAHFLFIEHRFQRRLPDAPRGTKILQWTIASPVTGRSALVADAILAADPDVAILTDAAGAPWDRRLRDWLGEGRTPIPVTQHFHVLTRLPVRDVRLLAATRGITLVHLRIDLPDGPADGTRILLVDLPSDPKRERRAVADEVRALLVDQLSEPPDLVVGDFNMTAGSASIARCFPAHHDAFTEGGVGYGATFRRDRPFFRIDHVLLGPGWRCTALAVRDAAIGRHRPQVAWVEHVGATDRRDRAPDGAP